MTSKAPRILIVEARFYTDIADNLFAGAQRVLDMAGMDYQRIEVPGVFEVPAAVRFAVRSMEVRAEARYSGFITLGCVIRGETSHYDHICDAASQSLMDIAVEHCVAHGFGILTVENRKQAEVRADPDGKKNVGGRAAEACLRMMEIKKQMQLELP